MVSVIVPFYNENPQLILNTIKNIHLARGDKEIIVVDDGSTDKSCYFNLKNMKKTIPFKLIRYEQNKGKRYAQCLGFKEAKGDIIVTIDSDTILDENAIVNLIRPFSDERVGATTGQLNILNERKNLLTRLQAARYWNAFNFERQSQGVLGVIVCCCGAISAYRKSIIWRIMPEYLTQEFLGRKCTFGDDRHLTTLMLKNKYKIRYVRDAIAYTHAPESLKTYVKQQIRWKKSFLRETLLLSKFMFKTSKLLAFEVSFTTSILFLSIFARIGLIVTIIVIPAYLFYAVPMILIMTTIHSLYVLFKKPRYFGYSLIYGFMHVFLIYWLIIPALLTLRDIKWGTR